MIVFRTILPKCRLEPSWDRAQIAKAMREARRERELDHGDCAFWETDFRPVQLMRLEIQNDLFRTHEILRDMSKVCRDRQNATDLDILADLVGGAYWRNYY